ncbi:MAG: capsule assembly Wzi family protein, partial [Marinobacter sp.]
IDRWWGPGHHSSLAISNNARPVPGLWFGRQTQYAPRSPWLNWIGPWDFQAFVGQLEQDRAVPDAKLVGGRLTFRPASFLQIGLTRLFQWGGEGRPQTLDSIGDALIGKDNGQQNTDPGDDKGPSNQIAGFDFRTSFPVSGMPVGFYGQMMGEDEAGYLPSKYSALVGLDALTGIGAGSQRFFLEGTDTVAGRAVSDARLNTAYEHGTYRSGFRYYGRNIASTFEGDARALTLGVQQFFRNGAVLTASATSVTLNAEGGKSAQVTPDGAEILQANAEQDIVLAELRLEHGLLGGRLTWALAATDEAVDTFAGEREQVTAMAQWRRTFDW